MSEIKRKIEKLKQEYQECEPHEACIILTHIEELELREKHKHLNGHDLNLLIEDYFK